MQQQITTTYTDRELTDIITNAVNAAIDRKLQPPGRDELLTDEQAREYLKCSSVFLWKKRKEGKIKAVNAGSKVLYRKSALDSYLQLKKGGKAA